MLKEIRIRNMGVIADATLELSPGLNVVTGETGAGKTMVGAAAMAKAKATTLILVTNTVSGR